MLDSPTVLNLAPHGAGPAPWLTFAGGPTRNSLLPDDRFVLALLREGQADKSGWIKAREQLQTVCVPFGPG